jgi:hypothetical protein
MNKILNAKILKIMMNSRLNILKKVKINFKPEVLNSVVILLNQSHHRDPHIQKMQDKMHQYLQLFLQDTQYIHNTTNINIILTLKMITKTIKYMNNKIFLQRILIICQCQCKENLFHHGSKCHNIIKIAKIFCRKDILQ